MRHRAVIGLFGVFALTWAVVEPRAASETQLVRYPHYHNGRIVFTYFADVWTADENGQNVRRLTVNRARDVYPRFSPDGQWIAFSSDRQGNLDVYVVPANGGTPKPLTAHSADDTVLGWAPDSKSILFASNRAEDFTGKLYTVGLEGGMPRNIGADMAVWATFSPDGGKLAINRHGQAYWRKYYRGSNQTDVTIMDVAAKRFTTLTDFKGQDSWPMWGSDRSIYFVSDRDDNGVTNIWRVAEQGGNAERVTTFKTGDVRWPAISADGKVITFEHDFGIWKLDVATRKTAPVTLQIAGETQDNLTDIRSFNSEADDYSLEPAGRRVAISIYGELFTAPTEQGDLVQLTDGAARDMNPVYSPDGRQLAYVSDASGREEIYIAAADGTGQPDKISNVDALKTSMAWSSDSKAIAYVSSDNTLRRFDVESKRTTDLASSKFGAIGPPAWSPDGKWIAYSRPDYVRTSDVYLVPATGGEERKVTFDSYNDSIPRFAPNGKKLYLLRSEGFGRGGGAGGGGSQIYAITLEREERDPDDPVERPDTAADQGGGESRARQAEPAADPVTIDWPGLERRTRQVTRMPFSIGTYTVAPDSRTLAFVTTEPAGLRTVPVLYTIQPDGRRLTRVVAGGGGDDDDDGPGGGGRGGGAGMSDLNYTRDGRNLYFREGRGIYAVSIQQGGGPAGSGGERGQAAGGAPSGGREASRRRINFTPRVRIDLRQQWAQMFGDAWRTMKYRFYDSKMHGYQWDAMKAKYEPLVQHVGDRQELLNVINEMIGELNASHTGAAGGRGGGGGGPNVSTGYLGFDLEPDTTAGRYKVTHIYREGPADHDWVKVSVGDYLLAIDDKPVKAGDEYWALLNHRLNRKVEVTLNSTPSEKGAWKTRIAPITQGAHNQLRYERWVKERRAQVDKLSNGRIGYLHIQAMNQPSLQRFEKELRENRNKDALVIDQRWNGGGNIDQELLAILVQRQYQIWQPRGTEPNPRPFAGFFGPKIVMQNWRSASNAEMFPAGFRALGLGKVVGQPTAGAVIGTGSYSLIDGATVRTPGTGVFLADPKRTNMENYGVPPDIFVENTPEDNVAGRDRELELAVQELLKELSAKSTTTAGR
jgi:tricorn protease